MLPEFGLCLCRAGRGRVHEWTGRCWLRGRILVERLVRIGDRDSSQSMDSRVGRNRSCTCWGSDRRSWGGGGFSILIILDVLRIRLICYFNTLILFATRGLRYARLESQGISGFQFGRRPFSPALDLQHGWPQHGRCRRLIGCYRTCLIS